MNRRTEINTFLKSLAKIYIQNPNLSINSDVFYDCLMNYDISEEERKDANIRDNFVKWSEYFKSIPNIAVYHTPMQNRFLQFSHDTPNYKCIKLYLSFPKDKIYECVNKVFKYVAANNMKTASKVADIIRADSVVLRLDSIEDAKKVINFVNNDLELSNNCKKTNPFLLKEGKVGIAYDHMLSYNTVLSFMLELYFKYCRSNNRLNEVSIDTFKEYIDNFRYNVFSNKNNLKIFLENPEISSTLHRFHGDQIELICNYEEIIKLISESLNPNMNLDRYFNFYNECLKEQQTNQKYTHYNNLMNHLNEIDLLNEYIKYAEKKYGGISVAGYLKRYAEGNARAITRDNNYRYKFMKFLTPQKLMEVTNYNIEEYVEGHLENKIVKNSSAKNYETYLNACIQTYRKYGSEQLYTAIISSIKGNFNYFTNGFNSYRDTLIRNNVANEVQAYIKLIVQTYGNGITGKDIYEVCTKAIINYTKQINNQMESKIM